VCRKFFFLLSYDLIKLCYKVSPYKPYSSLSKIEFLIKILKIYKNVFNLFINEPTKLQNIPAIEFNLTFDLGTYITSNKNKLNYYVGNDIKSEIYITVILSILKRERDRTVTVFDYSFQGVTAFS
jgi:hypothetical protein